MDHVREDIKELGLWNEYLISMEPCQGVIKAYTIRGNSLIGWPG